MAPPRKAAHARVGHREHPQLALVPPREPDEIPDPPRGLLKPTRDRWHGFFKSPAAQAVNLDADLGRLARWIHAVDEYERTRKVLRRTRLVRGSTGQPVLNPLAGYLAQLEQTIQRAEDAFGMTPASRIKIGLDAANLTKSAADLNRMLERPDDDDRGAPQQDDPDTIWVEG